MTDCYGPGNINEHHVVESVRIIEYRGDPSLPYVTRELCDGCIADVRFSGMEIKGEGPMVSDEADKLVQWVADTAFACGEWTDDDEEPYEELHDESNTASAKLRAYIANLEAQVASLSDATGVRA